MTYRDPDPHHDATVNAYLAMTVPIVLVSVLMLSAIIFALIGIAKYLGVLA